MKAHHVLFLVACCAAAIPILLALVGRDNYGDDDGISVEAWKKLWSKADRQEDVKVRRR